MKKGLIVSVEEAAADADAVNKLETKMEDAKREMEISCAPDEVRMRNMRNKKMRSKRRMLESTAGSVRGNVQKGGEKRKDEEQDSAGAQMSFEAARRV